MENMKKMIFLNIGWMKDYQGLKSDKIIGGGEFVKKYKYGHEIFNFSPFKGYMYGYVQPIHSINIERLGADKKDEFIDGILAVWVSKSPLGGTKIVGWYKNATIYRKHQLAPQNSNRRYKDHELGYFVKAREKDFVLLPIDERNFDIPRGEAGMGQSNVWYADKRDPSSFKQKVLNFIKTRKVPEEFKPSKKKDGKSWQPDPHKRQKIEKIAIDMTTKYFKNLGYMVDSFTEDNVGWDLEATMGKQKLRLEVKGLSQEGVLVELTPNEYKKMKKYLDSYRICVATKALSKNPFLRIFSFSPENRRWEDEKGSYLEITEIVSARMTL